MARAKREWSQGNGPSAIPDVLEGEKKVVPIDSIRPHPENARKGDVPAIKRSIEQVGFYGRVLVWKETDQIVVGSHRWKAMRELGAQKIPAEFVSLTERQARKILATDNRSSDLARYDDEKHADLLRKLNADGDLEAVNYTDEYLADLIKSQEPKVRPREFESINPGGMHLARKCPQCGHEF